MKKAKAEVVRELYLEPIGSESINHFKILNESRLEVRSNRTNKNYIPPDTKMSGSRKFLVHEGDLEEGLEDPMVPVWIYSVNYFAYRCQKVPSRYHDNSPVFRKLDEGISMVNAKMEQFQAVEIQPVEKLDDEMFRNASSLKDGIFIIKNFKEKSEELKNFFKSGSGKYPEYVERLGRYPINGYGKPPTIESGNIEEESNSTPHCNETPLYSSSQEENDCESENEERDEAEGSPGDIITAVTSDEDI